MTEDIHLAKENNLDVWCFETKPSIASTTVIKNVTCLECLEMYQMHLYHNKKYLDILEEYQTKKIKDDNDQLIN